MHHKTTLPHTSYVPRFESFGSLILPLLENFRALPANTLLDHLAFRLGVELFWAGIMGPSLELEPADKWMMVTIIHLSPVPPNQCSTLV